MDRVLPNHFRNSPAGGDRAADLVDVAAVLTRAGLPLLTGYNSPTEILELSQSCAGGTWPVPSDGDGPDLLIRWV